jgi:hypothetical protein
VKLEHARALARRETVLHAARQADAQEQPS